VPRYQQLYSHKYAPADYRKQVQGMVRLLQDRYGVSRRENANAEHGSAALAGSGALDAAEPEQVGFAF